MKTTFIKSKNKNMYYPFNPLSGNEFSLFSTVGLNFSEKVTFFGSGRMSYEYLLTSADALKITIKAMEFGGVYKISRNISIGASISYIDYSVLNNSLFFPQNTVWPNLD